MGCILACLRFKESNRKKKKDLLKSSPAPSKSKEPLLSKYQFGSVFVSEGSPCEEVEDLNYQDSVGYDDLEREIRDEAKYLKSCGTILETPAEFRTASERLVAEPLNNNVTLCLSATSFKKLDFDVQDKESISEHYSSASSTFEQLQVERDSENASSSVGPSVLCLGPSTEAAVLDATPSKMELQSSRTFGSVKNGAVIEPSMQTVVLDISPTRDDSQIEPVGFEGSICVESVKNDECIQSSTESVVLDVDVYQIQPSSSESSLYSQSDKTDSVTESSAVSVSEGFVSSQRAEHDPIIHEDSPSQDETQTQLLDCRHSPFATPLKLTDEMETPGTIFQSNLKTSRRKNFRVRTQYVYPVLNPVGNLTELSQLSDKLQKTPSFSSLKNQNDKRSSYREKSDKENQGSVKRLRSVTPSSPQNQQLTVWSLSEWMKLPTGGDERLQSEGNAVKYSCAVRTPDTQRPIFGNVAMHWNENDQVHASPKWWGGNGIPNTTTKYKEDQKVSWHATPFEERLDKALSKDAFFPQRKEISRNLVGFEAAIEEIDANSS